MHSYSFVRLSSYLYHQERRKIVTCAYKYQSLEFNQQDASSSFLISSVLLPNRSEATATGTHIGHVLNNQNIYVKIVNSVVCGINRDGNQRGIPQSYGEACHIPDKIFELVFRARTTHALESI